MGDFYQDKTMQTLHCKHWEEIYCLCVLNLGMAQSDLCLRNFTVAVIWRKQEREWEKEQGKKKNEIVQVRGNEN